MMPCWGRGAERCCCRCCCFLMVEQVEEIQVRIFPMDAEVLFSTSPFSIADHGAEVGGRHSRSRSNVTPSPLVPDQHALALSS